MRAPEPVFWATRPQYIEHLAPIWRVMDPQPRFVVANESLRRYARNAGVNCSIARMDRGQVAVVAAHRDYSEVGGARSVVLVEHGAGQTYLGADGLPDCHESNPGGNDRDRVGLYVCPSKRVADANAVRYPKALTAVVGVPYLDPWHPAIIHEPADDPVTAISIPVAGTFHELTWWHEFLRGCELPLSGEEEWAVQSALLPLVPIWGSPIRNDSLAVLRGEILGLDEALWTAGVLAVAGLDPSKWLWLALLCGEAISSASGGVATDVRVVAYRALGSRLPQPRRRLSGRPELCPSCLRKPPAPAGHGPCVQCQGVAVDAYWREHTEDPLCERARVLCREHLRDKTKYPSLSRLREGQKRALPAGPVTAISFHWNNEQCPESRWAYPHYRSELSALAAKFNLIGHSHPNIWPMMESNYVDRGIEPVERFADVLNRADIYVCDNSSTAFEFAATRRPVILMNAPWYRHDVHHGLRFWDVRGHLPMVATPQGLHRALDDVIDNYDRHAELALRFAETVYDDSLDGLASHRAARAITEFCGGLN